VSSSLVNENYQTKNSRCKRCFKLLKHHLAITDALRESFGIALSSLVNENYQTKNSRCKRCFQIIEAPFSNYGSPQGILWYFVKLACKRKLSNKK
jgi:hypothetical protein